MSYTYPHLRVTAPTTYAHDEEPRCHRCPRCHPGKAYSVIFCRNNTCTCHKGTT